MLELPRVRVAEELVVEVTEIHPTVEVLLALEQMDVFLSMYVK